MTTIAVSKQHKSIACDLQYTTGNLKLKGRSKILTLTPEVAKELFQCKQAYVGFCGYAAALPEITYWFSTLEGKPPKLKGNTFLLLADNRIFVSEDTVVNWWEATEKHYAVGSGSQFALAAMDLGKTPLEAVKYAATRDVGTGMGFKEYLMG